MSHCCSCVLAAVGSANAVSFAAAASASSARLSSPPSSATWAAASHESQAHIRSGLRGAASVVPAGLVSGRPSVASCASCRSSSASSAQSFLASARRCRPNSSSKCDGALAAISCSSSSAALSCPALRRASARLSHSPSSCGASSPRTARSWSSRVCSSSASSECRPCASASAIKSGISSGLAGDFCCALSRYCHASSVLLKRSRDSCACSRRIATT